jgi:hypothetical protein
MAQEMPVADKPGAQFQDHPNLVAGCAAMPRPLANFAGYEFTTQGPTPACRFRRFPVASIAAGRPGLTVADALARLQCQGCGARPEIVLLVKDSISGGAESIALRIEADAWRSIWQGGQKKGPGGARRSQFGKERSSEGHTALSPLASGSTTSSISAVPISPPSSTRMRGRMRSRWGPRSAVLPPRREHNVSTPADPPASSPRLR